MKIAVASGKGGAGKTSVVTALARVATSPLFLVDCDVEAPNSHLLLPLTFDSEQEVQMLCPAVREGVCHGCGQCAAFCAYHALVCFGQTPLLMEELCHGCGGCARVCPRKAIHEVPHRVGAVRRYTAAGYPDLQVAQGVLDIGIAMASPLIRAAKAEAKNAPLVLIDAPPGTACATATTLEGVDFVLLVAEETRFGQHDLSLAVDLVRAMALPFAVVINRVVKGRNRVARYCKRQHIPVLAEIPEDRAIAESYIRGAGMVEAMPGMQQYFAALWQDIASVSGWKVGAA